MASIISNTVVSSLGRAINIALGITALGLISRFLGVEKYGLYALLLAFGSILQITADFGLYLTLTRTISEHPHKENFYLSHITSLRFVLWVIVFGLGGLLALLLPQFRNLLPVYIVIAAGFAAQSFSQLMMGVYQKYGTVWRATIGDIIGRLVQVGGILFIGATHATLITMVALFSFSLVVAAFIHRRFLPSAVSIKPAFSWGAWRTIIIASWPLGALLLFNIVYFRIDTIMLAFYTSSATVGFYGLSYRLIESGAFFPAMLGGLLLPHLSAAWQKQNKLKFKALFQQGLILTLWVSVPLTLILILLAQPIIVLIAGPDFIPAAPLFKVLSLALFCIFIGNLASSALVACRRHFTLLILAVSLAGINIVLNLIFIPRWGALAAALTTLATECLAALIVTIIIFRLIRFSLPIRFLLLLLLISAFMAAVLIVLPSNWHLIIRLALIAPLYFASSVFVRLITTDKLNMLFSSSPSANANL